MSFWCLQFPPKNERKHIDLRFHSIKIELVRSFFGGNVYLKKTFDFFWPLPKFCYMFTSLKQCFYILLSSFLMQLVVDLFDFSIECSKFISVFVQFWSGQGRKFLESLSLGQKGCCQEMFNSSFSYIITYSS